MKSIVKRNKIILFTIALMLIVAGYMNYNVNNNNIIKTVAVADSEMVADLGDAKLVSSVSVENDENVVEANSQEVEEKNEEDVDEYFTQSRIDRDKMYSQMLESYEKILNNENVSEEQKNIIGNEIKKVNDIKNAIMVTENLIKNKGIKDVVVFVSDRSTNVVIKQKELANEQVSQIQNIVQREIGTEIEDIHISNKN